MDLIMVIYGPVSVMLSVVFTSDQSKEKILFSIAGISRFHNLYMIFNPLPAITLNFQYL